MAPIIDIWGRRCAWDVRISFPCLTQLFVLWSVDLMMLSSTLIISLGHILGALYIPLLPTTSWYFKLELGMSYRKLGILGKNYYDHKNLLIPELCSWKYDSMLFLKGLKEGRNLKKGLTFLNFLLDNPKTSYEHVSEGKWINTAGTYQGGRLRLLSIQRRPA